MEETLNKSEKMKWCITVLIALIIFLIPSNEIFTMQIKSFCIITIVGILLMAFELIPAFIAATFMPIGYWLLNIVPATTVFNAWTQQVPWVLVGSLIVSHVMDKTGVSKRIAYGSLLLA